MSVLPDLPPLTGSLVLDPWRIRHRLDLQGLLEPEPRRAAPTRSEDLLWQALEPRAEGWLREHSTGLYRLDFYCPALRLAVEVDGGSHYGRTAAEKDALRDQWHALRGIVTRRFSADHVEREVEGVIAEIARAAAAQRDASAVLPAPEDPGPRLTAERPPALDALDVPLVLEPPSALEPDVLRAPAPEPVPVASETVQRPVLATVEAFEDDLERAALGELAACRTVLPERVRRQLLRLIAG